MKYMIRIIICLITCFVTLASYAEESSGALIGEGKWWFETPTIPDETETVVIKATFTNLYGYLSWPANPYQLWAYQENGDVVSFELTAINIIEVPETPVAYNDTFNYEIKIDISDLSDLTTLAFRIVTNEGGTMHPSVVPASGSDDEVTFINSNTTSSTSSSSGIIFPVQTPSGQWVMISM